MDSPPDRDGADWLIEVASKLGQGSEDGFWRRHGFESYRDYIEHMERSWDKVSWARQPRKVPDVPPPALAGGDEVASELASRRRSRQVGMRLTPDDYELLAEAAKLHGVAPSTLARILTVAGARALVNPTRSA
jgi:hypothetical protein